MSETTATSSLEHLLANAAWARRLAHRLTRDADEGEDLVQEALLATLERPSVPAGAVRPWLGAVMANLFRSRLRSQRRRGRRERAVGDAQAHQQAAGPDEALGALEVHRQLATLVAELPEPYRQTVVLRYFEDRTPAEIAAMTDTPAGTVRWRLKTGLDHLRARLDDRHGGRKAWVALMLPFGRAAEPSVDAGPTALPSAASPSRLGPVLSVGLSVLMGAGLLAVALVLLRRPPHDSRPTSAIATAREAPAASLPPAGPNRPPALAASPGETLATCSRRIEDLRLRERDVLMKIGGEDLFDAGGPNPAAQAELGREIERVFAPLSRMLTGHALDCRSYACRLQVLTPDPRPDGALDAVEAAMRAVTRSRARQQSGSYELADARGRLNGRQAVGGDRVHVTQLILALEDPSGRPVPLDTLAPGEPRQRRAVYLATQPAAAAPTLARCQADASAAGARVSALEQRWDETKPPWVRFDEAAPDASLTALVTSELRRAMAAIEHRWFYVVACRGQFCRVDADDPSDNSKRNDIVRPMDRIIRGDDWFKRRVAGRSQNGAVYIVVREPGSEP